MMKKKMIPTKNILKGNNKAVFPRPIPNSATYRPQNMKKVVQETMGGVIIRNELSKVHELAQDQQFKDIANILDTLKKEVATLNNKDKTKDAIIGTLTSEIGTLTSEIGTLMIKDKTKDAIIETLTSEIGTLKIKDKTKDAIFETLTTENGTLTTKIENLTTEVADLKINDQKQDKTITFLMKTHRAVVYRKMIKITISDLATLYQDYLEKDAEGNFTEGKNKLNIIIENNHFTNEDIVRIINELYAKKEAYNTIVHQIDAESQNPQIIEFTYFCNEINIDQLYNVVTQGNHIRLDEINQKIKKELAVRCEVITSEIKQKCLKRIERSSLFDSSSTIEDSRRVKVPPQKYNPNAIRNVKYNNPYTPNEIKYNAELLANSRFKKK